MQLNNYFGINLNEDTGFLEMEVCRVNFDYVLRTDLGSGSHVMLLIVTGYQACLLDIITVFTTASCSEKHSVKGRDI